MIHYLLGESPISKIQNLISRSFSGTWNQLHLGWPVPVHLLFVSRIMACVIVQVFPGKGGMPFA
jgi:hypothetical protein